MSASADGAARARSLLGRTWNELSDRVGGVHVGLGGRPPGVTLVSVYRRRNADNVRRLVSSLGSDSEVRLHALDEPAPGLADLTVSTGPGMRMDLIADLLAGRDVARGRPVVIADDDVRFVQREGLQRFLTACDVGGLDIAMPAHHESSVHTFRVTRRRPWRTARLTSFVEVGPLVWLSTTALDEVLPFPPGSGMGWGVDVRWSVKGAGVLRLAVVDATPVRHLGAVGAAYGVDEAREQSDRMAASVGVDSAYDLAHDLGPVWRAWRRRPPWSISDHLAGTRPTGAGGSPSPS